MGPRFREDDFYGLAASSRSRSTTASRVGVHRLAEGETSGNDVTLSSKTHSPKIIAFPAVSNYRAVSFAAADWVKNAKTRLAAA
jgi:hypothetical protein